jgi:hypothetical protein
MKNIQHNLGNISLLLIILILILSWALPVEAGDFHAFRWDFYFGNHIDTHQQAKLKTNKNGEVVSLSGFFYIIFTGEIDSVSGLPVARHPRGAAQDEECGVDVDCVAGWLMKGVPAEAKFLYHTGVNGDDHPVWMVNRVDIPQPGSFTHFHWITYDPDAPTQTTDTRAETIPPECNQQNAGQLEAADAANQICPGWFLEIRAIRSFAFKHGGEIIPVYPGIDNATHLNIVTNYSEVTGIEPTRNK